MSLLAYHFDITVALRTSVQRDLQRRSRWYRRMQYAYVILPCILIAIPLLAGQTLADALRHNLFVIVGLPLVGFVGVPWINRWSLARQERSNPVLGGPQSFALVEDGLEMENRAGRSLVRWATVMRVVETPDHILFYYSPGCAYFLPRAAIPHAELAAVRAFITAHVTVPTEFAVG